MRHLPSRSNVKRSRRNDKSYLLHSRCIKTHQDVVLVKQRSPINPITVLESSTCHSRALLVVISLTRRNYFTTSTWQQLATASLLAAPRNSSSHMSYRTSSKPWVDGLWIPFSDIGVRLAKLPQTTLGTYQPLANAYKATRSDLGVSLLRTSPWSFVTFFVRPSQVTML